MPLTREKCTHGKLSDESGAVLHRGSEFGCAGGGLGLKSSECGSVSLKVVEFRGMGMDGRFGMMGNGPNSCRRGQGVDERCWSPLVLPTS